MAEHDFAERLRWSERASDEPFWERVYRKHFPTLVGTLRCSEPVQAQYLGMDRVLFLSSGATLRVDEKKRSRDYDDILLEYEHRFHDGRRKAGWTEKDLFIDYLAYAFMPSRTCYLLPWHELQRVWRRKRVEWLQRFPTITAQNADYDSLGCAVPIRHLLNSMALSSVIHVPAQGESEEAA